MVKVKPAPSEVVNPLDSLGFLGIRTWLELGPRRSAPAPTRRNSAPSGATRYGNCRFRRSPRRRRESPRMLMAPCRSCMAGGASCRRRGRRGSSIVRTMRGGPASGHDETGASRAASTRARPPDQSGCGSAMPADRPAHPSRPACRLPPVHPFDGFHPDPAPGVRATAQPPVRAMADKAYSSRADRRYLRRRGINAVIRSRRTSRPNRRKLGSKGGRPPAFDRDRYKERDTVEGFACPCTGGGAARPCRWGGTFELRNPLTRPTMKRNDIKQFPTVSNQLRIEKHRRRYGEDPS
ncbi:MAG: Transposase domain protein [Sphaerisporangium sp.]|nr:Transposase domain protein [Sphaerisporangium sp.]